MPSAIQVQVVPVGRHVVSWLLAGAAAAGTIALSVVAILQLLRDKKRQEREDTPYPLLTGRWDVLFDAYELALVNLSPYALWIDGAYARWWKGAGELLEEANSDYADRQRLVEPSERVGILEAFRGSPEITAEAVVVFRYAPTGSRVHRKAWKIHGQEGTFQISDVGLPAWFLELAGPRNGD